MSRTMAKPKKLRDELVQIELKPTESSEPQARRYMPPQCSCCTAFRADDKNDYTRVMSTRREEGFIVRYLKCAFCGNTFKHSEPI